MEKERNRRDDLKSSLKPVKHYDRIVKHGPKYLLDKVTNRRDDLEVFMETWNMNQELLSTVLNVAGKGRKSTKRLEAFVEVCNIMTEMLASIT